LAVKFLYYFLFVFIIVSVFLIYQKPYDIQRVISSKEKPNLEVYGMINYSLSKDGIAQIIRAKKVLRFNSYDEFYDIDTIKKSKNNLLEKMKSDSGKLVKNNLSLIGNVRYNNSNGIKFQSQKVNYNLKTKVFRSDVDFTLEDNRTVTYGSSMVYKSIEGRIYANNIKSRIEVDIK